MSTGIPMFFARVKASIKDLLELVFIPGLAAILPWPLCFRVFRSIAGRWKWLYRLDCESALRQAHARGIVPDDQQGLWLARRRLTTLIDHADLYLAATRSNAWMRKHMRVTGHWPAEEKPGVLCMFHWGAGMWALRHAQAHGMHANALVAPVNKAHYPGRPVVYWYARVRTGMVTRVLKRQTLDVSLTLRPALRALMQGEQILAAIDVPSDQVAASIPLRIAGMNALVPSGLLRLAVERRIPVTLYNTGFSYETGERHLSIQTFPQFETLEGAAEGLFVCLDELIAENSAAWHFWHIANRFFAGDPPK